jgi:hypothetical protein
MLPLDSFLNLTGTFEDLWGKRWHVLGLLLRKREWCLLGFVQSDPEVAEIANEGVVEQS